MSLSEKIEKLKLKSKVFELNTRDIIINYSDNLDGLFDEMTDEDFGEDERFPYYINIWESGPVLSKWLLENVDNLDKMTAIELGSGTGVAGIALATSGCRVIFTDYEEYSVKLCRRNAEQNGITNSSYLVADWRKFPEINEKINIVLCSDLLYENKQVIPLFSVTKSFIKKGSTVYISDPGRGHIETYISLMNQDGMKTELLHEEKNPFTSLRNIKIYKITSGSSLT